MASSTSRVSGGKPVAVEKTKLRKPARGLSSLTAILGVTSALFVWGVGSLAVLNGLAPAAVEPATAVGHNLPRPHLALAAPIKSAPERQKMRDLAFQADVNARMAAAIAESDKISLLMLPRAMQLIEVAKSDRLIFTRVGSVVTAEAMGVLRDVLTKADADMRQALAASAAAEQAQLEPKPEPVAIDPIKTASIAPQTGATIAEEAATAALTPALAYAPAAETTAVAVAKVEAAPFSELLTEEATDDHGALPTDGPLPASKPRIAVIPQPEPVVVAAPQRPVEQEKPKRKTLFNMLAYAKPDNPVTTDDGAGGIFNRKNKLPGPGSRIAVYVIEDQVVHMPNGEKLKASSGRGKMRDNPKYVHVKNFGPTPPNVYSLRMREARFHGVEAIRMTPVGSAKMYNRDGFLTHTYLLRRPGDSSGCVVFADYNRFLKAFKRGDVRTLIVVPSMRDLPKYTAML